MKQLKNNLILLVVCTVFCISSPVFVSAETVFSSSDSLEQIAIANNNTYTMTKQGSPYIFEDAFFITQNITVNVDPGVEIIIKNNKSISIENGTIHFNGTEQEPISIVADTSAPQFNIINATANIKNTTIKQFEYCLSVGNDSVVSLNSVTLENCANVPLSINANAHIQINNLKYKDRWSSLFGSIIQINVSDFFGKPSIAITNTTFDQLFNIAYFAIRFIDVRADKTAPLSDFVDFTFKSNSISGIHGNVYPFYNSYGDKLTGSLFDVSKNYWGQAKMPYFTTTYGGDQLYIDPDVFKYDPVLKRDPATIQECCSSVLFIPGIQASRLYNKGGILNKEDQLWEPNPTTPPGKDIEELYYDENGNPVDSSVYTRDIIERTNSVGGVLEPQNDNFYLTFANHFRSLQSNGTIKEYTPLPYDWRENVTDVINNGITYENTTIYPIDEIIRLADQSHTGKVTIITHSNGGLFAKALVKKLEESGRADLVDKVIMVAPPQLGTPLAVDAISHGLDFGIIPRLTAIPKSHTRHLSLNIPMTYTLLPSQKYYERSNEPIIKIEKDLDYKDYYLNKYGESIDTYQEVKDFILNTDDIRSRPLVNDVSKIEIGNSLQYQKAETVHTLLDNYTFPANIDVYEVSGTGKQTFYQNLYSNKDIAILPCLFKDINTCLIARKRLESVYGDGTVLNLSSDNVVPNAKRYYLDLLNTEYKHPTMLESQELINFLSAKVQNQDYSSNTITKTKPLYNTLKRTVYRKNSPLDIHLYDKDGNHTGPLTIKDENGNDITIIEENVPNSIYTDLGESAQISVIGNDEHTLKLDGYDTGTFSLDIEVYNGDTLTNTYTYHNLPTTKDTIVTKQFIPGEFNIQNDELLIDLDNNNTPDIKAYVDKPYIDLNKKEEPIPQPIHSAPVLILSQINTVATETKQQLPQAQDNTPTQPLTQQIPTERKQEKSQQTPKKEIKKQTTKKPTPKQIKKSPTVAKPKQTNTNSGIINQVTTQKQNKTLIQKLKSWFKGN